MHAVELQKEERVNVVFVLKGPLMALMLRCKSKRQKKKKASKNQYKGSTDIYTGVYVHLYRYAQTGTQVSRQLEGLIQTDQSPDTLICQSDTPTLLQINTTQILFQCEGIRTSSLNNQLCL